MVSQPSTYETPQSDQPGVRDDDQPKVRPADDEEGHVYADVVGPARHGHKGNGCDALAVGGRSHRTGSVRLQQAPDSNRDGQHAEKMNPAMRYYESGPNAYQTNDNDDDKAKILPGYNSPGGNPAGKEESQEKSVINIGGSEGRDACGQHSQISIHKTILSFLTASLRSKVKSRRMCLLLRCHRQHSLTVASVADGFQETACELGNAIRLAPPDSFSRTQ